MISTPDAFEGCYKPQIRMRMIFTGYSINSAVVTLILTMGLIVCDEMSMVFDRLIWIVAEYMYIVFGPVLLTFCGFGLVNLAALASECTPDGRGPRLNMMDLAILSICITLSCLITFIYAL